MLAIAFDLVGGRYHATPWEHHVNEGQVAWPPSPWRIARALVAAAVRTPEGITPAVQALTTRLASTPPVYTLPPSMTGHTRHYMPSGSKTTKVIDAFVAVDRTSDSTVIVVWSEGDPAERELLASLLPELSYLGRAESWVEARLLDTAPDRVDAWPLEDGDTADATVDLPLLADDERLELWRDGFLAAGGDPQGAPRTPWEALTVSSADLHAKRWSSPPGLRRVRYGLGGARPVPPRVDAHTGKPPTVALFAVRSRVLPRDGEALSLGEKIRLSLIKRSDGAPVFTGKQSDGTPLEGNTHAWVIPACGKSGIDLVAVWSRSGFDPTAVRALQGFSWIHRTDKRGPNEEGNKLRLLLLGLGDPQDFAGSRRDRPVLSHLDRGRVWQSVSPFVCFRHPKRKQGRWRDTPEDQVALAVKQLHPQVQVLDVARRFSTPAEERRWARDFYRRRLKGGGSLGGARGHAFIVTLDQPVQGPLSLGYAARMGLGQMVPIE